MGGGGILGIDVMSGDLNRDAVARVEATQGGSIDASEMLDDRPGGGLGGLQAGKVRILRAEDVERERAVARGESL